MRTRHMATLEAIRFGETMRQVAGGTQARGRRSTGRSGAPPAALDRTLTRTVADSAAGGLVLGPPSSFQRIVITVGLRTSHAGCRGSSLHTTKSG